MTRREVRPHSPGEMRKHYPIEGKLENWFFRVREISNGAWATEGEDLWGRQVGRNGSDPEELLQACIADAKAIVKSCD